MSYKTILVHVDQGSNANERIAIAARIASAENAHLVGAASTGISRYLYQTRYVYEGAGLATHLESYLQELREQARASLDAFEDAVRQTDVRSLESRQIDDEAGAGLSLQSRYADLVVIGQADPDNTSPMTQSDFPEFVVMHSARPTLIVPYTGHFKTVGERVLVAWDASASATRAVTAAIPLLRRAAQVDVVVLNPDDKEDAHGAEPGSDIALYLARHDVKVNVARQSTRIDIGNALLSIAADLNADMLVMGGYGHSRFREILLGGVTRTVLQSMTVPVLMMH